MFMIATIQRIVSGIPTPRGQRVDADEREREAIDPDPEPDRNTGGGELPAELPVPRQPAKVVDDPDRDRDGRAEENAAVLAAGVKEGERRHEHPEEERQPAEPRHRQLVDAPPAGQVDDAEPPRHPSHRRREQNDDDERDNGAPDDVEIVGELVDDAEMRAADVPDNHGTSVLRRLDASACAALSFADGRPRGHPPLRRARPNPSRLQPG